MIVKGYRGGIEPEESQRLASKGIYVFNSLCVGCREHVEWAYQKAQEMFENKKNIARKMHIEMMLILSGRRQISEGIKLCSSEKAESVVAISELDFELPLERDDSVIEFNEEKEKYLGILPPMGKCDAFFENSAMLNLKR